MMEVQFLSSVVILILIAAVQSQRGIVLNRYCNDRRDCAPFGYVCGQNQTCQCDKFYIPNRYGDKCVGGVEQKCRYDEHCVEGAFCELQIKCKCKEDLSPVDGGFACSRSKQLTNCEPQLYVIASLIFYLLKVV